MKKLEKLKVMIIGLGQIGGSIAIDLVEQGLVAQVTGFDKNPSVTERAIHHNIIRYAATSLVDEVPRSDLVILAAPIREIIRLIPQVCDAIYPGAAIMDVAGVKTEILKAVSGTGRDVNYISGHPLAGDEKAGLQAAHRHKFLNRTFVLTPFNNSDKEWLYTIVNLVSKVGAKPLILSAEEHDRLVAITSHLPYALSLALLQMATQSGESVENISNLAAGSFQSATRVAASSPELILDMFLTNGANITKALDELISRFSDLRAFIQACDEKALSTFIQAAGEKRKLFIKDDL